MNDPIMYVNTITGEVTESRDMAKAWYHDGYDVAVYWYSEVIGETIERVRWEH